jgi:pyridoxal phosphate enzyme (YggS family)
MSLPNDMRGRLDAVLEAISAAVSTSGRSRSEVTLVAVTKTHPVSVLHEFATHAAERGIPIIFGENYIQKIKAKRPELDPSAEIHLIGPLQSNKVRDAVALCDVIQSVHSLKILELVAKEAARISKRQRIYLQVNISSDPGKSGFSEDELPSVIERVAELGDAVQLEGLMTITAFFEDPEETRPDFRKMAAVRDTLIIDGRSRAFHEHTIKLSMGMSSDFGIAIEEGADLVRIGTALFGERG